MNTAINLFYMHPTSKIQRYPNRLSKKHLFLCALLTGLIFTYAGENENLLFCLTHPIFLLNLFLNTSYACLHFHFAYHLHFKLSYAFKKAFLISFLGFLGLEVILWSIGDYDAEDHTELFSITLPFGTLLILIVNLVFHLLQREAFIGEAPPAKDEEKKIWLNCTKGRLSLDANEIQYAKLMENHLEIFSTEKLIRSFYSLKQLEELVADKGCFFRLNKQFLANRNSIQTYKTMPDGRLHIGLKGGEVCKVSRNKASSFKKWIEETS